VAEAKRPCRLCGLTSEAHQDYHPGIQHGFEAERVEPAALDLDYALSLMHDAMEPYAESNSVWQQAMEQVESEAREARRLREVVAKVQDYRNKIAAFLDGEHSPNPIGSLHGAGMNLAYKEVGEVLDAALADVKP